MEPTKKEWAEQEALASLDRLLEQWPGPERIPDVRGLVLARARQDLEPRPRRRFWLSQWGRPAWAAAWVLGGMLAGLALWTGVSSRMADRLAGESMAREMMISIMETADPAALPLAVQPETTEEDLEP